MKYIYRSILLAMLAASPLTVNADNETGYLSEIDLRDLKIDKQNREVALAMVFDLGRLKLPAQQTVAFTPVLVSQDGSRETAFPPVVVDGKTRNRIYLRARQLRSVDLPPYHDGSAQTVICRRNGSGQSYDYRASLPFEAWMLGGRIELREQVFGCANCLKATGVQPLPDSEKALAPFVPVYRVDRVMPEPEPVKRRAESRVARLQFPQGSYKIVTDFRDNRAELDAVSGSVELVKNDADITITGIHIVGYASPEGSEAHNLVLSENRAKALVDYIHRRNDIPSELLHVAWKGEDWDGFVNTLRRMSDLPGHARIMELIGRYADKHDYCEAQIRKLLSSEAYKRLLAEVYPALRRNEYRIEYNVRNFNIEEARRQIETRPEMLSLAEMYAVADACGEGTEGHRKAILTAARIYPDKVAAVVNAALMEMERGDVAEAVRMLQAFPAADAPEVQNALGVAYARQGVYDKAVECLRRAKDAGSATAAENLKQVSGAMQNL